MLIKLVEMFAYLHRNSQKHFKSHFTNHFSSFSKIVTFGDVSLRKKFVYNTNTDIVAHFFQLSS